MKATQTLRQKIEGHGDTLQEQLEALSRINAPALSPIELLKAIQSILGSIQASRGVALMCSSSSGVESVAVEDDFPEELISHLTRLLAQPVTGEFDIVLTPYRLRVYPLGVAPGRGQMLLALRTGTLPRTMWTAHISLSLSLLRMKVATWQPASSPTSDLDTEQLARLYRILKVLEPTHGPVELSRLVLERLRPFVPFDVAGLLLEEGHGATASLAAVRPICKPLEAAFVSRILQEHLALCSDRNTFSGLDIKVLPPVGFAETQTTGHPDSPFHGPLKSRLSLPLILPGGEIIGRLVVSSREADAYGSEQLIALSTLVNHLGSVLRNRHILLDLERQAKLDGMTELYNYRTFRKLLSSEISRATRHGKPLSLVLVDVDHFKQVNDTYGHLRGDDVLKGIARLLLAAKRNEDIVARYGGEEFVLILPETSVEGARRLAERMRVSIEQSTLLKERPVTASFGITTCDGRSRATCDQLVARADAALYRAKGQGRNRVELAR